VVRGWPKPCGFSTHLVRTCGRSTWPTRLLPRAELLLWPAEAGSRIDWSRRIPVTEDPPAFISPSHRFHLPKQAKAIRCATASKLVQLDSPSLRWPALAPVRTCHRFAVFQSGCPCGPPDFLSVCGSGLRLHRGYREESQPGLPLARTSAWPREALRSSASPLPGTGAATPCACY
jgi:hypothetical protein